MTEPSQTASAVADVLRIVAKYAFACAEELAPTEPESDEPQEDALAAAKAAQRARAKRLGGK